MLDSDVNTAVGATDVLRFCRYVARPSGRYVGAIVGTARCERENCDETRHPGHEPAGCIHGSQNSPLPSTVSLDAPAMAGCPGNLPQRNLERCPVDVVLRYAHVIDLHACGSGDLDDIG